MQLHNHLSELFKKLYYVDIPKDILIEVVNMVHETGKLGDKYTIRHCEIDNNSFIKDLLIGTSSVLPKTSSITPLK